MMRRFESAQACAEQLAADVVKRLQQACDARGGASLVVSGGSTPVPFFHALRNLWNRDGLIVTLADERFVASDHADSNERLVREHLLNSHMQFVSLYRDVPWEQAESGAEKAMQKISSPFDVVILGMGDDGHTASLFPQHVKLAEGLDIGATNACMAIDESPKPPARRITLTAARLLQTQALYLHITGETKAQVLQQALDSGDVTSYPVLAFVAQKQVPVEIFWAP